ncbi:MAG: hypothetical protein RLZZ496_442, partial [Pseudomonadota bacterium]
MLRNIAIKPSKDSLNTDPSKGSPAKGAIVRRLLIPSIVSAIAFVILCGLGFWQLERLYEKEAFLQRIDQSLKADAVAMPVDSEWSRLKPDEYTYRKVFLSGH